MIIDYASFTPSWYIYTNEEGEPHVQTFSSELDNPDPFFVDVSRKICFGDIDGSSVHLIYYKGIEVACIGWQPGMKFEYQDLDGNTVWVGYFPEWEH